VVKTLRLLGENLCFFSGKLKKAIFPNPHSRSNQLKNLTKKGTSINYLRIFQLSLAFLSKKYLYFGIIYSLIKQLFYEKQICPPPSTKI
jgi:hypothetical protein